LAGDWTADDTVLRESTVSKVSVLVFTIAGGQVNRSIGVESGQGVIGMKDLNLLDNFLDGTIESKNSQLSSTLRTMSLMFGFWGSIKSETPPESLKR